MSQWKREECIFVQDRSDEVITNQIKQRDEGWKLLVVDDDEDVHNVTEMVLQKTSFMGRPFELLRATSEMEAQEKLKENSNITVVLLDVVMEELDSGLRVVKYIRDTLNDSSTRIILRSGQPGIVSKKSIMTNYEVDDYLAKESLTSHDLVKSVFGALRSYCEIKSVESHFLHHQF